MKYFIGLIERFPTISKSWALIVKETLQMVRDKSTLTLGIILPIMLLVLFGYGLSFDVQDIRVCIVKENSSPMTRDIFDALNSLLTLNRVLRTPSCKPNRTYKPTGLMLLFGNN